MLTQWKFESTRLVELNGFSLQEWLIVEASGRVLESSNSAYDLEVLERTGGKSSRIAKNALWRTTRKRIIS